MISKSYHVPSLLNDRPINRILIANRGEISVRIAEKCRQMNIQTVSLASRKEIDLPHARCADQTIILLDSDAPDSLPYLDGSAIIEAAQRVGADAIHPGYGFLAEDASFAEAVICAGLIWIGPPPAAMRIMGNKTLARNLAAKEEIRTIDGYAIIRSASEGEIASAAARIDYPLIIKAALGGGGRGIRRVDRACDLSAALASARQESIRSCGHSELLLEKLIDGARHIEIQIIGDQQGHLLHLFERECSIQRRHQKIIEEAPSGALSPDLRQQMTEDALRLARAANYSSLGTVEFLVDYQNNHYFLEMNTRLQVEYAVTEAITGCDLIALQIDIAAGRSLPMNQNDIRVSGHAIEARLCAEDPFKEYQPSAGYIVDMEMPGGPGLRVDQSYSAGSTVGTDYDSLLAKVIAIGVDRDAANARLCAALDDIWIPGIATNLPLLRSIVSDNAWRHGDFDTTFLQGHVLKEVRTTAPIDALLAATGRMLIGADNHLLNLVADSAFRLRGLPSARGLFRWRLAPPQARTAATTYHCYWEAMADTPGHYRVKIDSEAGTLSRHLLCIRSYEGSTLTVERDGVIVDWRARLVLNGTAPRDKPDGVIYVQTSDGDHTLEAVHAAGAAPQAHRDRGLAWAPTAGTVCDVFVRVGDTVSAGDRLIALESMKMIIPLEATMAGEVDNVHTQVGESVEEGQILVSLSDEVSESG